MRIPSTDASRWASFSLAERGLRGDWRLHVEVQLGELAGRSHVWVEDTALANFVGEVQMLERTRPGRVELESMNPGELLLSISTMDSAGHLLLENALLRRVFVGAARRPIKHALMGGFELDASSFRDVVEDFRSLAAK